MKYHSKDCAFILKSQWSEMDRSSQDIWLPNAAYHGSDPFRSWGEIAWPGLAAKSCKDTKSEKSLDTRKEKQENVNKK